MKLRFTLGLAVIAAGVLVQTAPAMAAPPGNDNFANRTTIGPALPINDVAGTTVDATDEGPTEPDHPDFGDGAVNSIWYQWVAPSSGLVKVDACDSDSFAYVGVYTGTAVGALTPVAPAGNCAVIFNAVATTSYKIALDGDGDEGATELDLRVANPPVNDPFINPIALPGSGTIAQTGTTVDSSREMGEIDPNDSGGSVWYTFNPSSTGAVAFSTCTSTGDPTLTVYTGNNVATVTPIVSNDDACNTGNQLGAGVSFTANAGTTYRIAVAALGGSLSEGTFTLRNVPAFTPPVVVPTCATNPALCPVNPPPVTTCRKGFKKVKGKCVKKKKKKKKKK